jgi:hypothetical protein
MEVYQMSKYFIPDKMIVVDTRNDDPDSIPFNEIVYEFRGYPDCSLGMTAEGFQLPEGKRLRDYSEAERKLLEVARREHADKVKDQANEFWLLCGLDPDLPGN